MGKQEKCSAVTQEPMGTSDPAAALSVPESATEKVNSVLTNTAKLPTYWSAKGF